MVPDCSAQTHVDASEEYAFDRAAPPRVYDQAGIELVLASSISTALVHPIPRLAIFTVVIPGYT
jgi:hypothetical protein